MTQSIKLTQMEALKIVYALARDAHDVYALHEVTEKYGNDLALCEAVQKHAVDMVAALIDETAQAEDNPIAHGLDYLREQNVYVVAIPASKVRVQLIAVETLESSVISDITDEEIFEKLSEAEAALSAKIGAVMSDLIDAAADDLTEKYSHPTQESETA